MCRIFILYFILVSRLFDNVLFVLVRNVLWYNGFLKGTRYGNRTFDYE